jgi:hypothetical protein
MLARPTAEDQHRGHEHRHRRALPQFRGLLSVLPDRTRQSDQPATARGGHEPGDRLPGPGRFFVAAPLVGYGFAWIGHFVFEKNRPATFKYPLYSLMGDFRLWFEVITGKRKW